MSNFLFLFSGREGSSPIIDWLDSHPDVVVPFFEAMDWYNEDIRAYEPIHRLADLLYRHGDFDTAKAAFASPAVCRRETHEDRRIGFKWRVWGDPEAVADVLARHRVKVFHLFRENLLQMAVSYYFSDVVIPRLEREQGVDLGGGGHFQFALAEKAEQERVRYLDLRSRIEFCVPPAELQVIIDGIVAAKVGVYEDYCRPMAARGMEVYSVRYEDFVEDQSRFFRRVCDELAVDFNRWEWRQPYFIKASSEQLLGQVLNLAEIERLPKVLNATATIRTLIYERHRYLFDPQE